MPFEQPGKRLKRDYLTTGLNSLFLSNGGWFTSRGALGYVLSYL